MMTEADLGVVGTSPTRLDAVEKVTGVSGTRVI